MDVTISFDKNSFLTVLLFWDLAVAPLLREAFSKPQDCVKYVSFVLPLPNYDEIIPIMCFFPQQKYKRFESKGSVLIKIFYLGAVLSKILLNQ